MSEVREYADGSRIRIDCVTDAWIYFVSWRPGQVYGSAQRMEPTVFWELVAEHEAKVARILPHPPAARRGEV